MIFLLLVQDAEIRDRIVELGDRNPEVREEATRALARMGPAALPEIRKALEDPDPEVALRAEWLWRTHVVRSFLSGEVLQAVPRSIERAAFGDRRVWMDLFLAAAELRSRMDLRLLAPPAVSAADG